MVIYKKKGCRQEMFAVELILKKHGFCLSSKTETISSQVLLKYADKNIYENYKCYEYHECYRYDRKEGYIVYDRTKLGKRVFLIDACPINLILIFHDKRLTCMAVEISKYIRYLFAEVFLLLLPLGIWMTDNYILSHTSHTKQNAGNLVFCLLCWSLAIIIFFKTIVPMIRDVNCIKLAINELVDARR